MKVSRRDIEKNLPQKGFRREEGGHHIYFYHQVDGKDTGPYTKVSHSPKFRDIGGDMLTNIRKQLRLDKNKDVVDLVNCPMREEQYNKILKSKGIV